MATFLYRVGRFAYLHRALVVGVWVALLLGALATTTLAKPFHTDFSLPGSESERATELLDAKFPGQGDLDQLAQAQVAIKAPAGTTLDDPANVAKVDAVVNGLRQLHDVAAQAIANPLTTPPLAAQVSPDRTITYLAVNWNKKFVDVSKDEIAAFDKVLQQGRDSGLTTEATGTVYNGQPPASGLSEGIGFGVALIVMVIAFASVVAAVLPILTALVGVGISVSVITGATAFVDMDTSALMIASMIGIAVSIDYALFIVSRYRTELADTDDRAFAAGRAVGTAGSSVVFAGLTVVIALLALAVTNIPLITTMGFTAALAVVIAVLAAVTLLPAILGLFGARAFRGRIERLRHIGEPELKPSAGLRWVKVIVKHPLPVLLVGVVALGVVAAPATKLELGMDLSKGNQKAAVDLIGQGFGEGVTGPLMIVADASRAGDPPAAYRALTDAVRGDADVLAVTPAQLNADGTGALISVIPRSGPTAPETQELVDRIRALEPGLAERTGLQYGITGQTAILADLSESLMSALVPYLALVLGLAFLVLMVVFRSLLVPLTATLGFLLSIGATFGATVAVFQLGWFGLVSDPGPIISFLPIFLIGIVFGLAMDYQVFLVTRMRERFVLGDGSRADAREAVVSGFRQSARVVTSAALIMISVFAAFTLSPDSVAKSMGFAMAVAVLFDAFVVRMMVIPAVMALLAERAWYIPRWLDRVLPNVDVEGKNMRAEIDAPADDRDLVAQSR
ncbi:MMPL family transporter [Mycobacterium sp. MYCO198283]|uniref:MMPL family transporter n=1 Tax=Mycobacterium sp. MYCO198283 TaxID=2883505 RepID=UPI001E5E3851|nr:MMPL family transporter [Mycobacterium sp. MYCO198283]MCG5434287.1 MMPL family transporter [Mycobacterium sp. MYCO198283]